ncbi:hypothetical protein EVAR_65621_1 [Eumeta japonica]|uniref:Uncharacterized protein n=1 Tax=Eumeta variegata TaxID=151549 RepID=A0A4C1Z8R3_EUMVA|nr:hypothetical protein EVAR_65621_1 [Eumeta japonica]
MKKVGDSRPNCPRVKTGDARKCLVAPALDPEVGSACGSDGRRRTSAGAVRRAVSAYCRATTLIPFTEAFFYKLIDDVNQKH